MLTDCLLTSLFRNNRKFPPFLVESKWPPNTSLMNMLTFVTNTSNVALACLYSSFKSSPKMHWYSASAWEHHFLSISRIIYPFTQMIPLFLSNSWVPLVMMLFPVPQDKTCLMKKRSENGQRLPNSSLRKKTPVKSPL